MKNPDAAQSFQSDLPGVQSGEYSGVHSRQSGQSGLQGKRQSRSWTLKLLLLLAVAFFAAYVVRAATRAPRAPAEPAARRLNVDPLPRPAAAEYAYDGKRTIEKFELAFNGNSDVVTQAFLRFNDSLAAKWGGSQYLKIEDSGLQPLTRVNIHVTDLEQDLQFNVSEAYSLTVSRESTAIEITADTVWGALHGLTTLQQLVLYDGKTHYLESSVTIVDRPFVPHRGVLVDSNRNFVGIDTIKNHIDVMALCKLNVLHWHFTDTGSWPMEIAKYPQMTDDAFAPDKIFTKQAVEDLVSYARARGIRIVPEFELPGHSRAGYLQIDPDLIVCGNGDWRQTAVEPPPGQLDVLNNKTYEVVQDIYNELKELFTDKYFHIGHDELHQGCYQTQKKYVDYFKNKSFNDLMKLWIDRALPIFNDRNVVMWEDFVTSHNIQIPKNVTFQSWLGSASTKRLTSSGYNTIVSNYDSFYLDCGVGGFQSKSPHSSSWCSYNSWQRIVHKGLTDGLSQNQAKHVIGGEVALWAENIDDSNFMQVMWPRAGAFAESSWSDLHDTLDFYQRLFGFREYSKFLGYHSEPIGPAICFKRPHLCPLG